MSKHSGKKRRRTVPRIQARKGKKPLTMVTAYSYAQARLVDEAGVDMILVGDSLANVCLGHDTTLPVTVEQMVYHTAAVVRGTERALVVGDMPFLSYNVSIPAAIENAGRFLKEAGADAVKLEGGVEVADTVRAIVRAGIPVVGHVGLTPQTVHQLGGYKVQGREAEAASRILEDARALVEAGASVILLECVPASLGRAVSEALEVPVIGIGAGPDTDGQILVMHDVLGVTHGRTPRFVKNFLAEAEDIEGAFRRYHEAVLAREFPAAEHCF